MTFSVTILGSNSALPTSERYPTAQVLNVSERFYLIDCGEGTQIQLRKYKVKFSKINQIFISHLHGDHCFGLMGLISTFSLLGRKTDLHIFAHPDLEKIVNPQLEYFCKDLQYKIIFHHINPKENKVIFDDKQLEVSTIPLKHRVPTCGFLFKEKKGLNHIKKEMVDFYQIPFKKIHGIKKGEDYITPNGDIIPNNRLTLPENKPRSYAFCSDTAYTESIVPIITNVDILYHESTFLKTDQKLANQTTHSTANQAAVIAEKAKAGKLILGHFSTRYRDFKLFKTEAEDVFKNVELAIEGGVFHVPYKNIRLAGY